MTRTRSALVLCGLLVTTGVLHADDATFGRLQRDYEQSTRPLLKSFCLDCHTTADKQGELDLERFSTFQAVRGDAAVWQKVAEMLDHGEMPPKDSDQLTPEQFRTLRGWVQRYLDAEAGANAGDPGAVPLRRLTNAEYTYTIQDLTGVPLEPAREFPADGAAGEGFTNAGAALSMSPALLQKYFDAGKEISRHAMLLPTGIRFSRSTSTQDWTEEVLAEIQKVYSRDTARTSGNTVNLQGVIFDTNGGGRLPIEAYLTATLEEREALQKGTRTLEQVATDRGLNAKYLNLLWTLLNGEQPVSHLLADIRTRWQQATPAQVPELMESITGWQRALFRFTSIGHIGKRGGPKAWMESISPLVTRQELKHKLEAPQNGGEVTLYLTATDAGDGPRGDSVVWERPRLVAAGRPDILLKDVRSLSSRFAHRQQELLKTAAPALLAASDALSQDTLDITAIATKHKLDPALLEVWFDYLGITGSASLGEPLRNRTESASNYNFIQGWAGANALGIMANSSDMHVRVPGNMPPHSVAVHPSPTVQATVAWRSPVTAQLTINATITHAHPECGNGVEWTVEVRRGRSVQRLANGIAAGGRPVQTGPFSQVAVRPGDLVALVINPRDGNHSCDLTTIDLTLASPETTWNLSKEVSPDILAGNPHADAHGNADVWHFVGEPVTKGSGPVIPPESILARWQTAEGPAKATLAVELQTLLDSQAKGLAADSPDAKMYQQLTSFNGPLSGALLRLLSRTPAAEPAGDMTTGPGLDPALFGKHPDGHPVDAASLCMQAPSAIELRLPAELANGAELVTGLSLHPSSHGEGSAQVRILTTRPESLTKLSAGEIKETVNTETWSGNGNQIAHATPILTLDNSPARARLDQAFHDFRQLFPPALCYSKIVPVDEVVTLTLFYREDEPLQRLMLSEAEARHLDALWNELHFVSRDPLTLVDAFKQLLEFASQDGDPSLFEPLRQPIMTRAQQFREELIAAEPVQLQSVINFAAKAWRRPLTESDTEQLNGLYKKLRAEELPHEEALRFVIARVLVAPDFLYRLEQSSPGTGSAPVSDLELANRLSYFLWSSAPDEELRQLAEAGRLSDPAGLAAQSRRMLKDPKIRRLATEFACQWLHVYDFDQLNEKSERHFPEFNELRGDMYEETIRFFTDLFTSDASVLSIYNADATFVNERLARFYGIDGVTGDDWQRIEGMQARGRGGILGLSTTLAKQSGASRTSPILRGNWISEVLLGERLPRPPKDVPLLPEDSGSEQLTMRQLVEKHVSDERCAHCHARIDPFGFVLEGFDAIGRQRTTDGAAGVPVDTRSTVQDGTQLNGLGDLRSYLLTARKEAVMRQFCKKLLGYSLGRSVQLSDEPLLREMQQKLSESDGRFSVAVELIVNSRQFRELRQQSHP